MSLAHMNGERPLVVVALRTPRLPWWRDPERVLRVVATVGIGVGLLVLACLVLRRPVPWLLPIAAWVCGVLALMAGPLGRPCVRCGRWTRHGLLCPRWRP